MAAETPVSNVPVATESQAPTKPKRAQSAYWLFTAEMRPQIMAELKEKGTKLNLGDIAKQVGEKWANIPAADKERFEAEALKDKERYEAEVKAAKEADPVLVLQKKFADLIPKKSACSYFLFSMDEVQRKAAAELLVKEGRGTEHKLIASKLGQMWKELSEEGKKPFEEKAKEGKEAYTQKLAKWESSEEKKELDAAIALQKPRATDSPKKRGKGKKAEEEPAAGEEEASSDSPKKPETTTATASPPKKRAKKVAAPKAEVCLVPEELLEAADKLSMKAALLNLAGREEVKGISADKMLEALKNSGGLVNAAKQSLLSAGGA